MSSSPKTTATNDSRINITTRHEFTKKRRMMTLTGYQPKAIQDIISCSSPSQKGQVSSTAQSSKNISQKSPIENQIFLEDEGYSRGRGLANLKKKAFVLRNLERERQHYKRQSLPVKVLIQEMEEAEKRERDRKRAKTDQKRNVKLPSSIKFSRENSQNFKEDEIPKSDNYSSSGFGQIRIVSKFRKNRVKIEFSSCSSSSEFDPKTDIMIDERALIF